MPTFVHLTIGIVGIIVFLATGIYMFVNFPELYGDNQAIRYMYRANHIYILLASLINLCCGIYMPPSKSGWRKRLARFGSLLIMIAPIILCVAFFYEAPLGISERYVTALGIYALLLGVLTQLFNKPFQRYTH